MTAPPVITLSHGNSDAPGYRRHGGVCPRRRGDFDPYILDDYTDQDKSPEGLQDAFSDSSLANGTQETEDYLQEALSDSSLINDTQAICDYLQKVCVPLEAKDAGEISVCQFMVILDIVDTANRRIPAGLDAFPASNRLRR